MRTIVDKTFVPGPNNVFVFGSNDAGIHGAGAARTAYMLYGAEWGFGEGHSGMTYAIPTKTAHLRTKSLSEIAESVVEFLHYAEMLPSLNFFVTRVGCGLAGYADEDIAPLFAGAPANVELPHGWCASC